MTDWSRFDDLKRRREQAIARARLASIGDDEPDSKVTVVIQQQQPSSERHPRSEAPSGNVELEKTAGGYKLRGAPWAVVAIVIVIVAAVLAWRIAPLL